MENKALYSYHSEQWESQAKHYVNYPEYAAQHAVGPVFLRQRRPLHCNVLAASSEFFCPAGCRPQTKMR